MSEYDSSLRSGEPGYDRNKAFKPYRTGNFDPEAARADMVYEQRGIDVRNSGHHGPSNSRPGHRHTDPRHHRRSSQAASSDSDETVRLAPSLSSKSSHRSKPSSNRPRSPAHSAISKQSQITARRLPSQDNRQQYDPYAQESTPSERTDEGARLSSRRLSNFNKTSRPVYDSTQAHFTPSLGAGSSSHHQSRHASSPQGPGEGLSPFEFQDCMAGLSISGNSDTRRTDASGGPYNQSLVSGTQQSNQRHQTGLSPDLIDTGALDMRDQMRDKLRPLGEAALRFVRPRDSITAHGAFILAQEQFISEYPEAMNRGNNTSAYPQHAVASSSRRSSDGNYTFDRSRPIEGQGRLLQAPQHPNTSERSAGSGARDGYCDPLAGRNNFTQRESSFASQQSDGYRQQPRTPNSLECLQVERYGAVPHPPSSRSTHQSQHSGIRDFVDPRSMHSAGRQRRRGPPMPPSRGGRYPNDIEEEWS